METTKKEQKKIVMDPINTSKTENQKEIVNSNSNPNERTVASLYKSKLGSLGYITADGIIFPDS